ncbi:MAG: hypothetical protein GY828_05670 [Candidatus Gracilibacteria bacterium]|nr:hypothetical protein [Candidatus Gracilibacteria bacterium]
MTYESDKFADRLEGLTEDLLDTYCYIKSVAKYYWKEQKRFFRPADVANNIMCSNKELNGLRQYGIINTYDNICYLKGGRKGCLNLLEEEKILLPSDNPILNENIKELIDSVCGYKQENIEYLHKAILYKYLNINDFTIPSIVFYGMGGSGKGTFITLLATIFGEDNVMANLGQQDLNSSFDTYKGQKIAVEFAEISANNTNSDIRILNKLKNIIGADKITVNEKGVQPYQIDNIAWFFISSNSNKPLQLDDRDKGNRRFTIIKSISKLKEGKDINKSIRSIEKVRNYLARLYKQYPEVLEFKVLEALNNQDKKELEERSQHESNNFWDWFEDNYSNIRGKITKMEVEDKVNKYCFENNLDEKDFLKYFWNNSRYSKKKIRIGDRTHYGVEIK